MKKFLLMTMGIACWLFFSTAAIAQITSTTTIVAGSALNTAGNNLIPSTGTGGCTVAPQTTGGTIFNLTSPALGANGLPVNLRLNITHTWTSDLRMFLRSPNGQVLRLADNLGGSGDNYTNTLFQDGAPSITTGAPPFTGTFSAQGGAGTYTCSVATAYNIPNFAGFTPGQTGVWQLVIFDGAGGDAGTMVSWDMTFTVPIAGCDLPCPEDLNISLGLSCTPFTIPAAPLYVGGECPQEYQLRNQCFTGPFAHNNVVLSGDTDCIWTFPCVLQLESSDVFSGGNDCLGFDLFGNGWIVTTHLWTAPTAGRFSFNWNTVNNDLFGPGFDGFGYIAGNTGTVVSVGTGAGAITNINVNAGDFIGFFAVSTDGLTGSLLATVSNFSFEELVTVSVVQTSGPVAGTQVGVGLYTRKFELRHPNGSVIKKCEQNIRVTGTAPTLVCNDHVNISLGGTVGPTGGLTGCTATLVPDMFLENYESFLGTGCGPEQFEVYIRPFGGAGYLQANGSIGPVPFDVSKAARNYAGALYNTNGTVATHIYEVRHIRGNTCWGTFSFEDKMPPEIVCPVNPRTVLCYEVASLTNDQLKTFVRNNFAATATDNCSTGAGIVVDLTVHKDFDACTGGVIKVKWIATDRSGNSSTVDCHIFVNPNVNWMCPDPLVELTCKDRTSPDEIYDVVFRRTVGGAVTKDTTALKAAYPFFKRANGQTHWNPAVAIGPNGLAVNGKGGRADGVCNIYTSYSDIEIDACGLHCHGNKKVIRTWTILNWCYPSEGVYQCVQVIKAVDKEGPTFIVNDTMVSTRPWDCTADFFLPEVWELHDNCDLNPVVTVKAAVAGINVVKVGNRWRAYNVPCGDTDFKYTAVDCCGNETTEIMTVKVMDLTPPTPVAKRDIVIGLVPGYDENGDQDGQAKLFAHSIDNGSHDNCSPVRIEIRRPAGAPLCGNPGNRTFTNNVAANAVSINDGTSPVYAANDADFGEFVKFCCDDLETAGADFDGDGVLDTSYHKVIMRVWDDGNKNGIIGDRDANGKWDNYNDIWAIVKVECKVPPVITCPPNATIYCDWAIETSLPTASGGNIPVNSFGPWVNITSANAHWFEKTGVATGYSVCNNLQVSFRDRRLTGWTDCNTGVIEREFRVTDKSYTRTCVQRITVEQSPLAQPWTMIFPANWGTTLNTSCMGPNPTEIDNAAPTWIAGPCDVIGRSTKVWQFDFEDGVCRKWKVEYKYVNWCDGKEQGPFYKYFVYRDLEAPTFDKCRDTMFAIGADCKLSGLVLRKTAFDGGGCPLVAPATEAWLKWEIFIDMWADGTDDYLFSSFVPNQPPYTTTGVLTVVPGKPNPVRVYYTAPTGVGKEKSITVPETIEGKMSNHKISWKVTDGCHNFATCHEEFMVVDKKPPTPYCVLLSTALMDGPNPMVEIWAIDFDKGSFDGDLNWPCTPQRDLLFTFDTIAPVLSMIDVPHFFKAGATATSSVVATAAEYNAGNAQRWVPSARSSAKVFTTAVFTDPCKKYADVDIKMTVWDKKLNYDWCWTSLKIICNGSNCPTPGPECGLTEGRVAGSVTTEVGQTVNQVNVSFSAALPEYPRTVMTGTNGLFAMVLPVDFDYEISASKDGDYLNGVSTLDLVLIQRHILGLQTLNSPYKLIAADATNDGRVTAADLTELRKLILGVTMELPNNSSWRFPIADQSMNATNPWPFAEVINIADLSADMDNQNFKAVKVGDVNGSVSASVDNPAIESRSAKTVQFSAEDRNVAAGETVRVAISGADFANVYGYQFTMNLNGASFADIVAGTLEMTDNNIGVLANDVVTMSYASRTAVSASEEDVLFTIVLKAEKSGRLSEMMSIGSGVTKAEAYTGEELTVSNVALSMRSKEVAADAAELFQNEPNPFRGQTTVSYYMPEAAKAVITVYDVTGRVITVRKADANKGMNSEVFTREQLGAAGVLYYRLESGDYSATKKMIVIE